MSERLAEQIIEQLNTLPDEQQQRLLDFARSLASSPEGIAGSQLLRFAGAIDADDVCLISEAVEEGCEGIDPHEW